MRERRAGRLSGTLQEVTRELAEYDRGDIVVEGAQLYRTGPRTFEVLVDYTVPGEGLRQVGTQPPLPLG